MAENVAYDVKVFAGNFGNLNFAYGEIFFHVIDEKGLLSSSQSSFFARAINFMEAFFQFIDRENPGKTIWSTSPINLIFVFMEQAILPRMH